MKLLAYIALFGLFGGASFGDSSEENSGNGCNHGEGKIGYKSDCIGRQDEQIKRSPSGAPPLPELAPLPPESCGVKRLKKNKLNSEWRRIVPGLPVETFYGEAPWMVRILADDKFVCGGTLIGSKAILTAAHCLNDNDVREWSVVVGEWNSSSQIEPNPTQKQQAFHVVTHKDFNHMNSANNIALITVNTLNADRRLKAANAKYTVTQKSVRGVGYANGVSIESVKRPFVLNETVGMMCLSDSLNMIDPTSCFAAGWGKDGQGKNHNFSPVLRKVNLPVMPNDQCQRKLRTTSLGDRFELMPSFICAGGVDKRDTCQGDGGGPLYCETRNDPNRYALYGIIAWGIGCGETNPTVFTSVPHYIDWITDQLEKYD